MNINTNYQISTELIETERHTIKTVRNKCLISDILRITSATPIVICLLILTAGTAIADGEIFLQIGESYSIPCLQQLTDGQEYEILIENPDIIGLDETGRNIVAVAAGISEVTVSIANPYAAYSYVFTVRDYREFPADVIYYYEEEYPDIYEFSQYDTEEIYDGTTDQDPRYGTSINDQVTDDGGTNGQGSTSDQTDDTERSITGSHTNDPGLNNTSNNSDGTQLKRKGSHENDPGKNDSSDNSDGTQQKKTGSHANNPGQDDTPDDSDGTQRSRNGSHANDPVQDKTPNNPDDTGQTREDKQQNGSRADKERLSFTHGSSLYDILLPSRYTLWISMRSSFPVSILYIGIEGMPLPYSRSGNMIYIRSDDIPAGSHIIQLIAADISGTIYSMKGYEIYKSK